PLRHKTVMLIGLARFEELRSGHLIAVVEIVDSAENLIRVGDIDDGAVREYLFHAGVEHLPLVGAMEVVAHEEAAAKQVFTKLHRLRVGQRPMPNLHSIKP